METSGWLAGAAAGLAGPASGKLNPDGPLDAVADGLGGSPAGGSEIAAEAVWGVAGLLEAAGAGGVNPPGSANPLSGLGLDEAAVAAVDAGGGLV